MTNSSSLRPAAWAALAFAAAYTLVAIIAAFRTSNREFAFYILVMFILAAAIAFVHRRINLSSGLIWMLSLWGALHMAGGLLHVPPSWPINGDVRVLYSLWLVPGHLKFDHIVHAFGFAATTWLCWQGLRAASPNIQPTFGVLTLAATAAMGFGALNEIVEFIATKLGPSNVGGYENTCWDLVSNAIGAIIAASIIRAFSR